MPDIPVKAEDIPPVFGKNDRWYVMDKYGNKYAMQKNPNDLFLKKNGNDMELHLVYSSIKTSKLIGQNKKDPF